MKFAKAESSALVIFAFGLLVLPQPKTGLAEPSQFNIFRCAILAKYQQHLRCKGASSCTSWTDASMDVNASKTSAQYCSVAARSEVESWRLDSPNSLRFRRLSARSNSMNLLIGTCSRINVVSKTSS